MQCLVNNMMTPSIYNDNNLYSNCGLFVFMSRFLLQDMFGCFVLFDTATPLEFVFMASHPTPLTYPPRNKALLRSY